MKQLLVIMLILMPLAGMADQIYRWTDEKGVVHFSSKPLDKSQDHELMPLPDAPTPTPGTRKTAFVESKTDDPQPQQTPERSSSQPTQEEIEYCKKLTANINTLNNSSRVRIKRDNGEFENFGR